MAERWGLGIGRMRRRRILAFGGVFLLLVSAPGCRELRAPARAAIELRLQQVYDVGEWLQRVPVEIAVGLYARSKVAAFVGELSLPAAVEARVLARVDADDFVDELVPFLLFLREMYQAPTGPEAETFDAHLRARFFPGDAIPGIEHDLFRWSPSGEEDAGGAGLPALSAALVQPLVSFYDVLYLQGVDGAASVDERLTCERRQGRDALAEATRRAAPAIRELLTALREPLGERSEIAVAVQGVLQDPQRLEAATAALVSFIDQTVCRNYRFFATRAFRTRQLRAWLEAELDAPGGGALWAYLERAQHERRYGAVTVVDGLQGKLLEALASGEGSHPFIQAIVAEQRRAGGPAPRARSLRSPAAQQTHFLDAFAERGYLHPHYLPFFRARSSDPKTHWVPIGISTTPTISVRNIPIGLTGAPVAGPKGTGLPNFHFVERAFARDGVVQGRAYYFFGSDAVELVALADAAGMQTLFERLPQLGSMSCTAQYDEAAHHGIDALLNLGLGEALRDFGERLCAAELMLRAENERTLRGLRARLLAERESLAEGSGLFGRLLGGGDDPRRTLARSWIGEIAALEQRTIPELYVAYNPWPDHFAHFEGPFADEIIAPSGELNRLDYWLGRVHRAYERAGVLDRAVFGMVGDHGLTPVFHLLNPEIEVFDALRDEGVDFRVEKISSDEGEGPKLTNPFTPPSMKGIDVVVASTAGGNLMLDLFVDQQEGFLRQPLASELRAVRPLAQPDAPPTDLIDEIADRLADSLDIGVVREAPCGPEGGAVRIFGTRRGARGDAILRRQGDRFHLETIGDGPELLGLADLSPYEVFSAAARARHAALLERCLVADREDPSTWCDRSAWRELTSYTARPDAVVQLGHLYDHDRAGTINLFPRDGVGYNSVVPGRHAGESFHEKNAFVAIWGTPLADSDREADTTLRSATNGAAAMAIHEFLSGQRPVADADGWGDLPLPAAWLPAAAEAPAPPR